MRTSPIQKIGVWQTNMTQKPRCLVIEDSLFDQKLVKRAVASARIDIEFTFANTLDAARQALAVNRYSVILCDNSLPDGNGTDFAQSLASEPKNRNTVIVTFTGWPSPFMWAKARVAGLQVIDKNNKPHLKLIEVFKRASERYPKSAALSTSGRRAGHVQ